MLTNVLLVVLMSFFSIGNDSGSFTVEMTGIGYGKPVGNCEGSGICIVTSAIKGQELTENFGIGEFIMSRSGSVQQIKVNVSSMTKSTIKRHFSDDTFLIEQAFEGELESGKNALKINIPAGKYQIKRTKNQFIIMIEG